ASPDPAGGRRGWFRDAQLGRRAQRCSLSSSRRGLQILSRSSRSRHRSNGGARRIDDRIESTIDRIESTVDAHGSAFEGLESGFNRDLKAKQIAFGRGAIEIEIVHVVRGGRHFTIVIAGEVPHAASSLARAWRSTDAIFATSRVPGGC